MPELTWAGKYDANGELAAPPRVKLPFQTVETVNQSAQQRQMALAAAGSGQDAEWRNRLIWGDKKYVLPSLLAEFAGRVDLIYIDPPFATGADFSFKTQIHSADSIVAPDATPQPRNPAGAGLELEYQPNMIEQLAYRDTWGGGLDTYLQWMHETLTFLRELLAESGSIYVHCDWRTSHYIKALMDNLFGQANFKNEIIWAYRKWTNAANYFQRNHDIILFYSKGNEHLFNKLYDPNTPQAEKYARGWDSNRANGVRQLIVYDEEKAKREIASERYDRVVYRTETTGTAFADWWEINYLSSNNRERVGYDTQKPEELVDRIISASSNEGDLVLDCFAGSGTTAAVAEKLGRRWIAADMGRFAISTTRKRLLSLDGVRPFDVQHLGRYERQHWQSAELEPDYRRFILQLYRAEPVSGYQWLHGCKGGRLVHIGAVDAPVTLDDVQRVAAEFSEAIGGGAGAPTTAGVDLLGWDFGLEADTEAAELGRRAGVNVRLRRIPREVMDQRAVDAGDIVFFELASLSVAAAVNKRRRQVTLTLEDFNLPLDGVPEEVRRKITHWSQWIDYWAVDWDYRSDAFNNQWQSYRTRQEPQLQLSVPHTYESKGDYIIVVKAIDILGNDATRRLEVQL